MENRKAVNFVQAEKISVNAPFKLKMFNSIKIFNYLNYAQSLPTPSVTLSVYVILANSSHVLIIPRDIVTSYASLHYYPTGEGPFSSGRTTVSPVDRVLLVSRACDASRSSCGATAPLFQQRKGRRK